MRRRRVLEIAASLAAAELLPGAPLRPRPARADPACERVVARVGQNHGHVFTVPVADASAGVEKTYDLRGAANHPHTVAIGADDWKRLRAGEILRMPSSRDGGHLHRLYVRCAPAVDPPDAINVCEITIGGKDDHEFVINAADFAKKADRSYEIQGISTHSHSVTVTAADFARLARGEEVTLSSSPNEAHTHRVYIRYPKKSG
jgi:hypothetical protein